VTDINPALNDILGADPPDDDVTDGVAVQIAGATAVVTLSRPAAHNALSLASWRRLIHVFDDLAHRDDLRAVVVKGAGGRAFAAGADIKEFPGVRIGASAAIEYNESIAAALKAVHELPVPVIAMIRGLAVGGGCELAAACDVRVADTTARFGIPIGRLGVILGHTEANALVRLIGAAELKYLLFSGGLIDAYAARQIGLLQELVEDPDQLVALTAGLIETILASSEVTIRAAKQVADMCGRGLTDHDTELLARLTVEAYDGPDLKEGVAAFEARRRPDFTQQRRTPGGRA
jgi:enoyl-CoA hydratase